MSLDLYNLKQYGGAVKMIQWVEGLAIKTGNMCDLSLTSVYMRTDSANLSYDLWMNAMDWVHHSQIIKQMQLKMLIMNSFQVKELLI